MPSFRPSSWVLFVALGFGLGVLSPASPAQAEDKQANCGLPGFVFLPCDPRFSPQRSAVGFGIQQIVFSEGSSRALYRGVPYVNVAKEADPLGNLIRGLRQAFTKQFGQNPQEAWGKSKNGVDFFFMDFGSGRFIVVGAVQEGYLLGAFQFPDSRSALMAYLQGTEVILPPSKPIVISQYPPMFPASSKPPAPAAPSNVSSWSCHSRGHYEMCQKSTGTRWERGCRSSTSEHTGLGSSRESAEIQANLLCSGHMTRMIIIGNISGSAHSTQPCRVYACRQVAR